MITKPLYLTDSYLKECKSGVLEVTQNGKNSTLVLDQTVFYPEGGGQPSDQGIIKSKKGTFKVTQVLLKGDKIIHFGKLDGTIKEGDQVNCQIDWLRRYKNMQVHSAGHILHEAVKLLFPQIIAIEGQHGKNPYIKYEGKIGTQEIDNILEKCNELVNQDLSINTEFVSLEELKQRSSWVPEHLPTNKPLRIMWIGNFSPIPDGGTQVAKTSEIREFTEIKIETKGNQTYVFYKIVSESAPKNLSEYTPETSFSNEISAQTIMNLKNSAVAQIIEIKDPAEIEDLRIAYFGKEGKITHLTKNLKGLGGEDRKNIGALLNETKTTIEKLIAEQKNKFKETSRVWFDPTIPGIKQNEGHLHVVTQAIDEISGVFEKIGFTRVRYPEVDWDWYAFGSLNFPKDHPARDDWETFFVDTKPDSKFGPMILTPHTSSGQVREMERVKTPPIRMVNIAKCYRRQSDISHVPMFHQFEGLVVDKDISIVHLKGTLDYFAKTFFGKDRVTRLRPYHFQFTEPSFEVDITCGFCNGKGCKLCKQGWLELGGAGMVHPNVLKAGEIDPKVYTGFAFGWGVERTYMMKSGLEIGDVRQLYSADLRFLKQF